MSQCCWRTTSFCSSQSREYPGLYLCCSQTDGDKCNCGLWFDWAFELKHSLSKSLSMCQQGPFVFQSVCACRLCLSATVCGKSGSTKTKMGHMGANTHKSQLQLGWTALVWGECYTGRPLLQQTWISHLYKAFSQHTVTHTQTICWMTHDCKPLSGIKSEHPHKLTVHTGRNKLEMPTKIYYKKHLILFKFYCQWSCQTFFYFKKKLALYVKCERKLTKPSKCDLLKY